MYMYPAPEDTTTTINESAIENYQVKIGYALPVDDEWWIGSGLYLSDLNGEPGVLYPPIMSDLVDFVGEARSFALDNGKEEAISVFNDPEGRFTNESRYIFALDYDGIVLATPVDPQIIGSDHSTITRRYGVKSAERAGKIAGDGGGFLVYSINNPDTGEDEQKLAYVLPVDAEWYLGSGIYLDDLIMSLKTGENRIN